MNYLRNKVKGMLAVVMMACLLLTMGSVSSNAEDGIAVCGEADVIESDEGK